jgi:hypothetical protein
MPRKAGGPYMPRSRAATKGYYFIVLKCKMPRHLKGNRKEVEKAIRQKVGKYVHFGLGYTKVTIVGNVNTWIYLALERYRSAVAAEKASREPKINPGRRGT